MPAAGLCGIIQEVTEQVASDRAINEAAHLYRDIFENCPWGLFQTTADGRYVTANPALARIYGYESPGRADESSHRYRRPALCRARPPRRVAERTAELRTAQEELLRKERRIRVTTESGPEARMIIADTGPGIAPDVLPNVFDPLYSTKSFGTGLGLPTVRQVVEQHGGTVALTSAPGAGTQVEIRLPRV